MCLAVRLHFALTCWDVLPVNSSETSQVSLSCRDYYPVLTAGLSPSEDFWGPSSPCLSCDKSSTFSRTHCCSAFGRRVAPLGCSPSILREGPGKWDQMYMSHFSFGAKSGNTEVSFTDYVQKNVVTRKMWGGPLIISHSDKLEQLWVNTYN